MYYWGLHRKVPAVFEPVLFELLHLNLLNCWKACGNFIFNTTYLWNYYVQLSFLYILYFTAQSSIQLLSLSNRKFDCESILCWYTLDLSNLIRLSIAIGSSIVNQFPRRSIIVSALHLLLFLFICTAAPVGQHKEININLFSVFKPLFSTECWVVISQLTQFNLKARNSSTSSQSSSSLFILLTCGATIDAYT